jgi:prevent-host-death family protein
MSIQTMPASDLRKSLHSVLNALDRPLFVTAHGRVKAVLMDIERYNQLMDMLEDLEDACNPEVARALAEAKAAPAEELVPLEDVLRRHGLQRQSDQGGRRRA